MVDFLTLANRKQKFQVQSHILKIRDRIQADWLKIPGISHVGLALKNKQGKLTGIPSLLFYVEEKLPKVILPEEFHIPSEIEGISTDVITIPSYELNVDMEKYRPLVAGVQIMNSKWKLTQENPSPHDVIAGSIGCFAKDAEDNIGLISNEHVMSNAGAAVGNALGQPSSPFDQCCCKCGHVATITKLVNDQDKVDCGFAILRSSIAFTNSIPKIGYIRGTAGALLNEKIRLYGRTSGYVEGRVADPSGVAIYKGINYQEQVIVSSNGHLSTGSSIATRGDSGSVYVNEDNKVIALHFASAENLTTSAGNQIQNVEAALEVTIIATPAPPAVAPLGGYTLPNAKKSLWDEFEAWESKFNLQKAEKQLGFQPLHIRQEIAHLIRNNRAIKVAWSRYQGPSFVGHLKKAAEDPDYLVPNEIQGISWKQLMLKMMDLMETHGSIGLRTFIDRYAVELLELQPNPAHFKQFLTQVVSTPQEFLLSPKN